MEGGIIKGGEISDNADEPQREEGDMSGDDQHAEKPDGEEDGGDVPRGFGGGGGIVG